MGPIKCRPYIWKGQYTRRHATVQEEDAYMECVVSKSDMTELRKTYITGFCVIWKENNRGPQTR